ncbi:unnamed protein product, partial [Laminaria digitata]
DDRDSPAKRARRIDSGGGGSGGGGGGGSGGVGSGGGSPASPRGNTAKKRARGVVTDCYYDDYGDDEEAFPDTKRVRGNPGIALPVVEGGAVPVPPVSTIPQLNDNGVLDIVGAGNE